MARPIITLTTDFGEGSPYVAQMKSAILCVNPEVTIVDITHSVAPQSIVQGSLILADVAPAFPPETIHVAVVDPGVGTERSILFVKCQGQRFVLPDNGLLTCLLETAELEEARKVSDRRFWRDEVSATFHGRDIMAPVAAHLSRGVSPQWLGPSTADVQRLVIPRPEVRERQIAGEVLCVDTFGNLITNISRSLLPSSKNVQVRMRDESIDGVTGTYGMGPPGSIVALIGSSHRLEIAIVNGNAAAELGVTSGEAVYVRW